MVSDPHCHVSLVPQSDAVLVPTFIVEHVLVGICGRHAHIHHLAIAMKSALAVYRRLGLSIPVLGAFIDSDLVRLVVGVPPPLQDTWLAPVSQV